jgi:hypothetical protein
VVRPIAKLLRGRFLIVSLLPLPVALVAGPASAQSYTYDIIGDSSQIDLTMAGSLFGGELSVSEQFPSDATSYDGSVVAAFPGWPGPGGSVGFPGGSAAEAQDLRGGFLDLERRVSPAVGGGEGTDPASYGVILEAPVDVDLPPIPLPDPIGEVDLGTLESVQMDVAIRDLVIDLVGTETTPIDGQGAFDASVISLSVVSGFADINGAFVLQQDNLVGFGVSLLALQAMTAAMPELGLTIDGNLFELEIEVGIGTRFDLSSLPGAPSLRNSPATTGTVSYDPVSGESIMMIPIATQLPDLDMPPDILSFEFNLEGQLVAEAVVPEPSSLLLMGPFLMWLLAVTRCRVHRR